MSLCSPLAPPRHSCAYIDLDHSEHRTAQEEGIPVCHPEEGLGVKEGTESGGEATRCYLFAPNPSWQVRGGEKWA